MVVREFRSHGRDPDCGQPDHLCRRIGRLHVDAPSGTGRSNRRGHIARPDWQDFPPRRNRRGASVHGGKQSWRKDRCADLATSAGELESCFRRCSYLPTEHKAHKLSFREAAEEALKRYADKSKIAEESFQLEVV